MKNKVILISIQPKWCELIVNGKKTVEVRKTTPKIETPFKCYIYCTKPKRINEDIIIAKNSYIEAGGKIIGEFICDKIMNAQYESLEGYAGFNTEWGASDCLTANELLAYGVGKDILYGWHISDLKIYDEPKELKEFRTYNLGVVWENGYPVPTHEIKRPPQSWCYVEEAE